MIFRGMRSIPLPCNYSDTEADLAELGEMGGGDVEPPIEGEPAAGGAAPPEPAPWQAPEYLMLGEEQVPWDKAQVWLSQGRNYSQRMAEFNQARERYKPYESLDPKMLDHFKSINDFVSSGDDGQNWWAHVQESWDKKNLPPELDPNIEAVVSPLNQQINQLSQTVQDLIKEKTDREVMSQDEALDIDIRATRDKFANIDFDAVDHSGMTLEDRVTDYAAKNGFPNWRAAFLDYYHDNLMEIQKSEVSKSAAAKKETASKTGIVGRTPAPQTKGDFKPYDRNRRASYDDLTREALEELGIN